MTQPSDYQQRTIEQGRKWVAGESTHNRVDDECCPDFSCCVPSLFESDRAKRVAHFNAWARNYGWEQILDS